MKHLIWIGTALFGVVVLTAPARALAQAPSQAEAGPQAQSKAEYDAYVALYNETNPQVKAQLGESFLTNFPDSEFASLAFMNLISAYETGSDWKGVMEASDRFLNTVADPDLDSRRYVYPRAIMAAQYLSEPDKIVRYGELLLEVDSENLGAMLTVASAITENIPASEPARSRALARAYDLALRARSQARRFYASSGDGDAQRGQVETTIHTALARIHYARQDYENAAREYVDIIRLSPRNGDAYYRLGDCYQFLAAGASREVQQAIEAEGAAREQGAGQDTLDRLAARHEEMQALVLAYMDRAIDSFATATAIGGIIGDSARQRLQTLYLSRHEQSAEGMQELIDQKRDELNSP